MQELILKLAFRNFFFVTIQVPVTIESKSKTWVIAGATQRSAISKCRPVKMQSLPRRSASRNDNQVPE